ncbi:MAG: ribosome biogenesis factor YjgA [Myxococcota bacterium]
MGMDEDNDDGLGGRSRDRREVTEANRWGAPLCALSDAALRAAPLPDALRDEIALGRTIRSYRARDRQYALIDRLVRSLEPAAIEAIDAFLADPVEAPDPRALAAEALLAGGDAALQAWIEADPQADRQRLRALLRNARRDDRGRNALIDALPLGTAEAFNTARAAGAKER